MTSREQALTIVRRALPPLSEINDLYQQASVSRQQAEKKKAQEEEKAGNKVSRGELAGLAVFIAMYALLIFLAKHLAGGMWIFWFFIMGVILACVVSIRIRRKVMEQHREKTDGVEKQLESYLDRKGQEIQNVYSENQNAIEAIPRDYRYYDAAVYMENVLANQRADSIKEALNLYEEALHRARLENTNSQILRQYEMQTAMMKNIEYNTARAANAAENAAFFSMMNYIK